MSPVAAPVSPAADRLWRDEIGLAFGVFGPFRLKTAFQPVYAPVAGSLAPVGAAATAWPFRSGRREPWRRFLNTLDGPERRLAAQTPIPLALGNAEWLPPGFRLFVPVTPDVLAPGDWEGVVSCLEVEQEHDVAASILQPHRTSAAALADLRAARCGLVIDAGSERGRSRLAAGDVASFGARWSRLAAGSVEARSAFLVLIEELRSRGVGIHIRDVADAEMLRLALEAGADFVQGPLLAPFGLAGSVDAFEPLPMPDRPNSFMNPFARPTLLAVAGAHNGWERGEGA